MTSNQPAPENVQLRYGAAPVFERADTGSSQLGELVPGDPIPVLGAEGDFYQVRLPHGAVGFIYWHNLSGMNMPLTASQRAQADSLTTAARQASTGWRGILHRLQVTRG
jgi:Bacterial SH3 domain